MREYPIKVAPSILASDFAKLGEEIERIYQAGADLVHVDVMDGHFVPNLTIGPCVVEALKKVSKLPLDVHLMISEPGKYLDAFIAAGADILTLHFEACQKEELLEMLCEIKSRGIKGALAFNPDVDEAALADMLRAVVTHEDACVDMVLMMTVFPGFGGQKFMDSVLGNIEVVAKLRERWGMTFDIEVDGGIGVSNADKVIAAGANVIVAGTAVFGAEDMEAAICGIRNAVNG